MPAISTLLIANRGEIAVRIIKTARRLGLRTVAVYSDADGAAPHVRLADTAVRLGPAEASQSYLRQDLILEAARRTGADAIHPGYGFLSENADFARTCEAAGIVFVGPPAAAIEAMGGKSAAKALMEKAGVPLVPGYHGDDQHPDILAEEAARIGFPVLIKASAGGGGKGMRVVEKAADFRAALDAAQREAVAAFGDPKCLIEKYLARPRHVEVQVFADRQGAAVYLFERDCSIQRRHQKVLEEAPAPGLNATARREIGEAAVRAAQAIGYVGAGTVEFLFEDSGDGHGCFYFMEMNTRLQVEHPVTELITGLDLVEWQLTVAGGAPLPLKQSALEVQGHAIEVRLYAEDPDTGFLPATGRLDRLILPEEGPHVRVDAGVAEGDRITIHYDPMIAKLIAWDHDRSAAIRRLSGLLERTQVAGLATNLDFLRRVARHPAFAAADLDTRFIDRHREALLPGPQPAPVPVLALGALAVLSRPGPAGGWADDPWNARDGWRPNIEQTDPILLEDAAGVQTVEVTYGKTGDLRLAVDGRPLTARLDGDEEGWLAATLDGVRRRALVAWSGPVLSVLLDGHAWRLTWRDPLIEAASGTGDDAGKLTAPMPGRVVRVLVAVDQTVAEGTPLIVLEAMKMEHTMRAPGAGTVTDLPFAEGDQVEEGAVLVGFDRHEG